MTTICIKTMSDEQLIQQAESILRIENAGSNTSNLLLNEVVERFRMYACVPHQLPRNLVQKLPNPDKHLIDVYKKLREHNKFRYRNLYDPAVCVYRPLHDEKQGFKKEQQYIVSLESVRVQTRSFRGKSCHITPFFVYDVEANQWRAFNTDRSPENHISKDEFKKLVY